MNKRELAYELAMWAVAVTVIALGVHGRSLPPDSRTVTVIERVGDFERADAVALRTAKKISAALDCMGRDSGTVAPQYTFEIMIGELTHLQPFFMRQLFEDEGIREKYYNELATTPASAPQGPRGG